MTMLSESPPAGWDANLPTRQLDDTGRRLEVPWEGPIDATVLLHLLKGGFEGDLRDMEQRILDHFRSLPRDEGIAFLRAANAHGGGPGGVRPDGKRSHHEGVLRGARQGEPHPR